MLKDIVKRRLIVLDIPLTRFTLNRDIIFVHVPKCGGKSVWNALKPEFRNKHGKVPTHLPLFCTDYPEGAFTFGFVRNPWDRQVSFYHYMSQRQRNVGDSYNKTELRRMGFKKWLLEFNYHHYEKKDKPIVNKWGVSLDLPIQKRSQMHWLEGCIFIGRFETLDNDLNEAARLGGFELRKLQHINRSKHSHYTKYYDNETIAFIAEHFSKEIDRFKYKYGEN